MRGPDGSGRGRLRMAICDAQLVSHSTAAIQLGCVERSSREAAKRCAAGAGLDGDEACRATIVRAVIGVLISPWRDRRIAGARFRCQCSARLVLLFEVDARSPHDGVRRPGAAIFIAHSLQPEGPRAGGYAQSSEPRPRGTSLAGGKLWAISCASTWRLMPRSRRGSNGTHCRPPTCGA
jgi:hypothetical protein